MSDSVLAASQHVIEAVNSIDLRTQRLSLRKFNHSDVEFNVAHEMDQELMQYIRDPLPLEQTRQKSLDCAIPWKGQDQQWCLVSILDIDSGDYMGLVCLRYESIENDTMEIGWRLDKKYHGKGYATEAAQALLNFIKDTIKPHKVTACCVVENIASSNIMQKLGMQQEALFRQHSKLGGKWIDEAIYAVILN